MGLGQSINNALGGLRATQAGIEISARNVANANTEGYTKKSLSLTNNVVGNKSFGVNIGAVTRQVDRFLQGKVQAEYSEFNRLNVQTQFLDYVDNLFGKPGAAGSLDVVVNDVSKALVDFANEPQLGAARQQVVENADYMASHLRDMSGQIQEMRQNTEHMIAQEVERANFALSNIARINHQLTINGDAGGVADLKDQLDNHVDDLAAILGIRTLEGAYGSMQVFTKSGIQLAGDNSVTLDFDEHPNINAQHVYHNDSAKRDVGTISITATDGSKIDFIQQGALTSGKIAGLVELRDKILTNAQDQLDELAHSMAMAFNSEPVAGAAVTVGLNSGIGIDLAGLADGNVVEFDYKDNATGFTHKISFVKVSDTSSLPLDNNVTADSNDKVFGIDFSGGMASVISQIDTAISGENPNFGVTLVGGSTLQIMDDGGANLVDVTGLSGTRTVAGVQGDSSSAMNLFTDIGQGGEINYSNNMLLNGQKRGFAGRIMVNSAVLADNTLLVKSATGTSIGDQTRPEDLLKRFTETPFTFNPSSGIGSSNAPYKGTIDGFARQVVADQTSLAGRHKARADNQELVLSALNGRMQDQTKVNVDEEMANLLVLQTAYSANARIVSVVKELMDMLMRM